MVGKTRLIQFLIMNMYMWIRKKYTRFDIFFLTKTPSIQRKIEIRDLIFITVGEDWVESMGSTESEGRSMTLIGRGIFKIYFTTLEVVY